MCGIDALVDVELFMAEADKDENGSIDLFELMAYTNKHKLQMEGLISETNSTAPPRQRSHRVSFVMQARQKIAESWRCTNFSVVFSYRSAHILCYVNVACAVSRPLDVAQKHGPSNAARHRGELWADDIALQLLLT